MSGHSSQVHSETTGAILLSFLSITLDLTSWGALSLEPKEENHNLRFEAKTESSHR
jgi:hypothetical protein